MIRLLAVDIDGTLFNSRSEISAANRRAIDEAITHGVDLVLATGKPCGSVAPLVKELGLVVPQITLNGGAVVRPHDGFVVHQASLSRANYQEVLSSLADWGIECVAYTTKGSFCQQPLAELEYLLELRELEPQLIPSLVELDDVVKVLTFVDETDTEGEKLIRLLHHSAQVIRTGPRLLELTSHDTDKGSALAFLARHLGLEMSEVAAIGDSENDLGMLREAGIGIAMGNATDQVKAACQWQVADHDHNGVAEAIGRIVERNARW